MSREKVLIILALIVVAGYSLNLHQKEVNKAYEEGFLYGKAGDAWIYTSWIMDDLELLKANDLDSLSKGLESQLDLHLGNIFLAKYIDANSALISKQAINLNLLSERNKPILERAAIYRSENPGFFMWQGSDSYNDLMRYLPLDTIVHK